MTSLASWVSPSVMRALGWALLHFLWQGTALAALAGASIALCRRAYEWASSDARRTSHYASAVPDFEWSQPHAGIRASTDGRDAGENGPRHSREFATCGSPNRRSALAG